MSATQHYGTDSVVSRLMHIIILYLFLLLEVNVKSTATDVHEKLKIPRENIVDHARLLQRGLLQPLFYLKGVVSLPLHE